MQPDRWNQIERLYHEALERGPDAREAFLDEACAGDGDLRREVARLLACDAPSDSFIQTTEIEIAAKELAAEPLIEASIKPLRSPIAGIQIGAYHLLEPLGRGGMGEVHLALDTRLGRKVALKLLPVAFTTDADRVQRFAREARAASALNHPNIITIHEIGETATENGSTRYIVTEYVEGETLRRRMASASQRRMKPSEAIEVAAQIAAALSAAHEAGITHRDIKPENVMVRPDGLVKVLDFGLAKLTAPPPEAIDSDALTLAWEMRTTPGMILGTLQYMSPEQVRARDIDARSDIFSLGVVLYEMIAGELPFAGETTADIIAAIINKEPEPLAELTRESSLSGAELDQIVTKALAKDRQSRYQTAKDLQNDLKNLKQELEIEARPKAAFGLSPSLTPSPPALPVPAVDADETPPSPTAAQKVARASRRGANSRQAVALIVAILLLAGAGSALYKLLPRLKGGSSEPLKISQLTSHGRVVEGTMMADTVAISPDGKYVAYVKDEAGGQSIYLRQAKAVSDAQVVPPGEALLGGLRFSGDGNYLYYAAHYAAPENMSKVSLQQVTLPGANTREILTVKSAGAQLALSPDEKHVAFVRKEPGGETALIIADVEKGEERKLTARRVPALLDKISWSPDGKLLACSLKWVDLSDPMELLAINVADGSERRLATLPGHVVKSIAWLSDGSGLALTAPTKNGFQISRLSLPGGELRQLTDDLNNYSSISLTADGKTMASIRSEQVVSLWVAPAGHPADAAQISSRSGQDDGKNGVTWTPDGKLIYVSTVRGNPGLWSMEVDGSGARPSIGTGWLKTLPRFSADGRSIVFLSSNSGNRDVFRARIGGAVKQLTHGFFAFNIDCSPDGKWVVFSGNPAGDLERTDLWRVAIEGGELKQVLRDEQAGVDSPVVSPDGKLIAFFRQARNGPTTIGVIQFAGGNIIKTFDYPVPEHTSISINSPVLRWTADGSALTYPLTKDGAANLWSQPLAGDPPTQLTRFQSDQIYSFDWARDGRLVVARGAIKSDVILINGIR